MAIRRVEIPPNDFERAYREWFGSRYQRVIHNLLVDQLEIARNTLENAADFQAFERAKTRIQTLKEVIGILHVQDTDTLKEQYGLK